MHTLDWTPFTTIRVVIWLQNLGFRMESVQTPYHSLQTIYCYVNHAWQKKRQKVLLQRLSLFIFSKHLPPSKNRKTSTVAGVLCTICSVITLYQQLLIVSDLQTLGSILAVSVRELGQGSFIVGVMKKRMIQCLKMFRFAIPHISGTCALFTCLDSDWFTTSLVNQWGKFLKKRSSMLTLELRIKKLQDQMFCQFLFCMMWPQSVSWQMPGWVNFTWSPTSSVAFNKSRAFTKSWCAPPPT